jgi:hypothetical protein
MTEAEGALTSSKRVSNSVSFGSDRVPSGTYCRTPGATTSRRRAVSAVRAGSSTRRLSSRVATSRGVGRG